VYPLCENQTASWKKIWTPAEKLFSGP